MDWDKIIVAVAQHGEKYIGEWEQSPGFIFDCMVEGRPILLKKARQLITQLQINQSPDGRVLGAGTMAFIMPIDGASGAVDIWIDISSFYWPKENPVTQNTLEGLLNTCMAAESQRRSGLSVAGPADIARLRKPEAH